MAHAQYGPSTPPPTAPPLEPGHAYRPYPAHGQPTEPHWPAHEAQHPFQPHPARYPSHAEQSFQPPHPASAPPSPPLRPPPAHPQRPSAPRPPPQPPRAPPAVRPAKTPNLHVEKGISVLSVFFSLLVIALGYVAILSTSEIFRTTIAPLVTASIFLVVSLSSALVLCATPGKPAKLAVIPIVFATVGAGLIILLNVATKALSNSFVEINLSAVLLSSAVFAGMGLGAALGFLLFIAAPGRY